VDKDTLEWPLANAALAVAGIPPDSHDCSLYVDTLKKEAYETMERVAEQQVKEARCPNVIMVAPFSSHVKDPNWQSRLCRRFFGSETCWKYWIKRQPIRRALADGIAGGALGAEKSAW